MVSGTPDLDLSGLPPIFVLPTHLTEAELHEIEDELLRHGALLTYDMKGANIVLGDITREKRAKLELKWGKVRSEEIVTQEGKSIPIPLDTPSPEAPAAKQRRLKGGESSSRRKLAALHDDNASTATDSITDAARVSNGEGLLASQLTFRYATTGLSGSSTDQLPAQKKAPRPFNRSALESLISVVNIEWFRRLLADNEFQPFEPYTIYQARLLPPVETSNPQAAHKPTEKYADQEANRTVMEMNTENPRRSLVARAWKRDRVKEATSKDFTGRSFTSSAHVGSQNPHFSVTRPTHLLHQTTSEHDQDIASSLPAMPDWVKENKIYACERATPLHPPNEEFIQQLEKIKLARALTGDDIGVRAYSTVIASLAAYPHRFTSTREILALPGCDQKTAQLFQEWQHSDGHIQAIADIEADPVLHVLRLFYEIWGVGAATAREFYYSRHWRDLDDIVEQGWRSLTRVQQIGVKYYDEFQLKIPHAEVESIAATIATHARRITDSRLETIIVGGHRRGKPESGDVDLILSHPSERVTLNLVADVVAALEASGCITHVLTLALTNSNRDQQPLPLRSLHSPAGHGFDTLDKALVVWQDTAGPSQAATPATPGKNPNPHRRVDIIVSPWRTVGCAVAGWTSGTTFQRDLRRYAKKVKGWKFDSSGVRERGTGRWVDLEGWADERTRCTDWRVAERRVFEGLGLVFREPEERCTG